MPPEYRPLLISEEEMEQRVERVRLLRLESEAGALEAASLLMEFKAIQADRRWKRKRKPNL